MDVSLLRSIASIIAGTISSEGIFKTTKLRIVPNVHSVVSTAMITSLPIMMSPTTTGRCVDPSLSPALISVVQLSNVIIIIDIHVADECPLTTINCDFHHVGCAVKLPRQDMLEHLRENLLTHISLLATSHAKQQAEITNLKAENDTLKRKHENLGHNYQYLEAENRRLKTKLEPMQQLLKTAPPIV